MMSTTSPLNLCGPRLSADFHHTCSLISRGAPTESPISLYHLQMILVLVSDGWWAISFIPVRKKPPSHGSISHLQVFPLSLSYFNLKTFFIFLVWWADRNASGHLIAWFSCWCALTGDSLLNLYLKCNQCVVATQQAKKSCRVNHT